MFTFSFTFKQSPLYFIKTRKTRWSIPNLQIFFQVAAHPEKNGGFKKVGSGNGKSAEWRI